jgi:hypothetical protein
MHYLNPRHALGAISAILLLLCVTMAWAGTATVTYTLPTTRADGSSLLASAIKQHRVEWGTCSGTAFGTKTGDLLVSPSTTSVVIPNLNEGQTYCFRAYTQDTFDQWSGSSNVFSRLIPLPAPPNPPVLTTVAVVAGLNMTPAYRVLADGSRGEAVIGFVPTGVACSGPRVFSYRSRAYHRVDPAAVKWWGTTATTNVAAPCA